MEDACRCQGTGWTGWRTDRPRGGGHPRRADTKPPRRTPVGHADTAERPNPARHVTLSRCTCAPRRWPGAASLPPPPPHSSWPAAPPMPRTPSAAARARPTSTTSAPTTTTSTLPVTPIAWTPCNGDLQCGTLTVPSTTPRRRGPQSASPWSGTWPKIRPSGSARWSSTPAVPACRASTTFPMSSACSPAHCSMTSTSSPSIRGASSAATP